VLIVVSVGTLPSSLKMAVFERKMIEELQKSGGKIKNEDGK
jgi:hypothetical protein